MKSFAITPRRRGELILLVVIVSFAICWYSRQSRPEHLKSPDPFVQSLPPPDSPYKLNENPRNHTLNLTCWTSPTTDFKHIASVPLPPGLHFDPISSRLLGVRGGLIYFTLVKEATLQKISRGGPSGSPYVPPIKPIVRHFVTLPSNKMTYLCCFAMQGGAVRTLLARRGIENIVMTDDTIYWIDPRPEPTTTIESKDGTSWTSTPASLLMAMSLKTLQTRQIADRVSLYVHLTPDHTSLSWSLTEVLLNNLSKTYFWYYAPDLAGPILLTYNNEIVVTDPSGIDRLIVLGDRLYWIENSVEKLSPPTGEEASTWRVVETRVMSIRRDGTQRSVILAMPVVNGSPSFSDFTVDRGRFYIDLNETTGRVQNIRETTTICRLDPGASQPLTRLLRLPASARVDRIEGGYVYYSVPEDHSSFLGYKSLNSLEPYRWKLPD